MACSGKKTPPFALLTALICWSSTACWNSRLQPNEIAERTLPSLVMIVTQGLDGQDLAQGSGFFIAGDLIATNLHVFKDADQAYVKTVADGVNYQIDTVVAFDRVIDLCILRLKRGKAQHLALGSSKELHVGDDIYVAANPKGLEGSISKGIVSAIRKQPWLIQIDAAISPGSSGGPVVDDRGTVVGIALGTYAQGQNLNFAVPIDRLRELKLEWTLSVRQTGILAMTDRDWWNFKGPVNRVDWEGETYGPPYTEPCEHYDDCSLIWDGVESYLPPFIIPCEHYESTDVATSHWVFNELGDLMEVIDVVNGEKRLEKLFQYYPNGIIMHITTVGRDAHNNADQSFSQKDSVTRICLLKSCSDEVRKPGCTLSRDYMCFDSAGRMIEAHRSNDEGCTMRYGPDGFKLEERDYSLGYVTVYRWTYEIDDYGNWVKRIEMKRQENDPQAHWEPYSAQTRQITYFKR
jgi:hypothetical protein